MTSQVIRQKKTKVRANLHREDGVSPVPWDEGRTGGKILAPASHQAETSGDRRLERSSLRGKPFSLQQTAETVLSEGFYAAGLVPRSIIDSYLREVWDEKCKQQRR